MFKRILTVGTVLAFMKLAGCAHIPTAPTEGQSKTFNQVAKHLQLGGPVFAYVDIDGDAEKAADLIEKLLEQTKLDDENDIPKGTVLKVVNLLGLDTVDALGMSSIFDRKGQFHNRAFIYTGTERKGILKFWGASPHPFDILSISPEDSDIVFEQDTNFKDTITVIESAIISLGKEKAAEVSKELDKPLKSLSISPRMIIEKSNTRIFGVFRIDPKRNINILENDFSFPFTEFLIGADNMGEMLNVFAEVLEKLPLFTMERGDVFDKIRMLLPLPGDLAQYQPIIARDNNNNRLYIASSSRYMDRCLLKETNITTTTDFTQAMRDLPTDGNGMGYVSHRVTKRIVEHFEKIASTNPDMKFVKTVIDFLLPKGEFGQGSVQKNLPDGILYAGNAASSHKQTLGAIGLFNPISLGVLSAVAIPAFTNYMKKSKTEQAHAGINACVAGVSTYAMETGHLPKPADWTPSLPPGSVPYQLDEALWSVSPWKDINFSLPEQHYYRFALVTEGTRFVCQAQGDLDSDGVVSLFEQGGTLEEGHVQIDEIITEIDPSE